MDQGDQGPYPEREQLAVEAVVAVLVHREHHIHVVGGRRLAQGGDRFGLDLTIGGQESDPIGGRGGHARLERGANAAVGVVSKTDRVPGLAGAQKGAASDLECVVLGAVIHEDDFAVGLVDVEPARELLQDGANVLTLVECKNDDAEAWTNLAHGRALMTLAGEPAATVNAGMLRVTTAPAPIWAPWPMRTPGRITVPAPMSAPSSITTG